MANNPKSFYIGKPSVNVGNPASGPTLGVSGTSSTLPAGTYYVRFTWVNEYGETITSPSSSVTTSSGQQIDVTLPTFPTSVDKAKIYISTTDGSETLQGETTTTTYVQSTDLVAGAAKPTINNIHIISTVPSTTRAFMVKNIVICNTTDVDATISVHFVPKGKVKGLDNQVVSNYILSARNTVDFDITGILESEYTIQATQGTENAVTLYVSGLEAV